MRSAEKTHKPILKDGTPKTRPIVGVNRGLRTVLGELPWDLITPVSRVKEDETRCQSTEELIVKIRDTNKRLEDNTKSDLMGESMDVEALHPSVDQLEGARMVAEEVLKSKIEYKGVDVRKAAVYLVSTMSKTRQQKEGIAHIMPRRKGKRGKIPTVRSKN